MALRVTNGVPSFSDAMTRLDNVGSGCATTCADTTTSSGISSPKNGELSLNFSNDFGSPQLIAPPTLRPPTLRRTGIKGSSASRLMLLAAMRGPAKRTNMPPSPIHSSKAACSASVTVATSARTMTSGLAGRTSFRDPLIRSAVGASAFSM